MVRLAQLGRWGNVPWADIGSSIAAPWVVDTPLAAVGMPPTSRAWAIFLGVAFACIAVTLLVASWTRWGQSKPLAKCVGIAFLAHVWLLLYAYGTRIVHPGFGAGNAGGVATAPMLPANVAWVPQTESLSESMMETATASNAEGVPDDRVAAAAAMPWESPIPTKLEQNDAPELDLLSAISSPPEPPIQLPEWESIEMPADYGLEELLQLAERQHPHAEESVAADTKGSELPALDSNPSGRPLQSAMAAPPMVPIEPVGTFPRNAALRPVPPAYQMRMSPSRTQFAYQNGGDLQSETAVQRALEWLSRAQSEEGAWSAAAHGAGLEDASKLATPEGKYRANAGRRANTAMTGLALLAFLGAGHTHTEGPYSKTVAAGLEYLQRQQFPSGDLSGRDQIGQDATVRYARMYSHGMASLAMAEAYAMTGDPNLLPTVQAAARYSMNAMNPRTGGWRYDFSSEDPGDTSQFGWQAMVLNSASSSGAAIVSGSTRLSMQRFLDSVSTGRAGGLAVYRNLVPQARPNAAAATPAMTAEALAMRSMLGFPITNQAAAEASDLFMTHLPGRSEENLYYWYYATLALYQLRAESTPFDLATGSAMRSDAQRQNAPSQVAWQCWNDAMKQQLCATQVTVGPASGSWNPTCIWGSYGGRVYSTAVACMCLEVYYRYLPVYQVPEVATSVPSATRK
jgi:hypothetical protein